ncbi:MAG: phosphoribosylamine--glycine ligase [Caulobacterales bacterium]|nr:phosphoribosylamine--glycine ligase [Caulobacterales bacterium]
MKILLVGGGGREHALAWKIAQSPLLERLLCVPGNPGTADLPRTENRPAPDGGVAGLTALARAEAVDLVVVGPEQPLADGLADALREAGVAVFGPSRAAARLETSKAFAKRFMQRCDAPTGAFDVFDAPEPAKAFLARLEPPYVLKADGLAAGKGVTIHQTRADAEAEIDALLAGKFADASKTLVIEEFLEGEEASFFALCDGETAVPLAGAQDHKRAFDGDEGPNTGGMGAYSPAPILTPARAEEVMATIVRPVIAQMAADGTPFQGVLYVGLMMSERGPQVVEFNVRFGDPECQPLMARLQSDLAPALHAAATGRLAELEPLVWDPRPAACVVMATRGYPGAYGKGSVIRGVDEADAAPNVTVFHAGTARDASGALIADGGRVLGVTGVGDTLQDAVTRAYGGVDAIAWPEGFCRRDIAWRALKR